MPIYVNADDPIQADAVFEAMRLFKLGQLTALEVAQIVQATRSDEEIRRDNEAAAREYERERQYGWLRGW